MMLSHPLPLLALLLTFIIALNSLRRSLSSPLNRLPGPWYARYTSLVFKYHCFRAHSTRYIHGLHRRYGGAVRVAPNEASFASASAVKEIYCSAGSGYDKTEFYDLFRVYGRRTMFTMLRKDEHARRKRVLADRYANSNVLKPGSMRGIAERAASFVRRCEEAVPSGGVVDLFVSEA